MGVRSGAVRSAGHIILTICYVVRILSYPTLNITPALGAYQFDHFFIPIRTRGGIYGKIWLEPK